MEEEYDREDSDEMELEPTPEELRRKELAQELKGQIKFRNYHPKDEVFRGCMQPPTRNYLRDAERRFMQLNQGIDDDSLLSLAPKKPNWDLKRDIEDKLEVLDRHTQIALLDLLKQKVQDERRIQK